MMQNSPASPKDTGKTDVSLLLSKTLKFLPVAIIVFASTQLGYHFWPLSSLVYGIRVDYLSPTLYFLDLLILLYLGLATKGFEPLRRSWPTAKMFSRATTNSETGSNPQSIIVFLLPILLTNLLYSQNPFATLNWSLHFVLYLSFLVALFPRFRSLRDSRRVIGTLRFALTLSLLFQLLISIVQVSGGHSVGGLMYYLGERSVAVGQPAVALGTFMDSVVLRAYGTFSHPNVLAGWSVITLLIILRLSPSPRSVLKRKTWLQAKLGSAAAERTDLKGTLKFWRPGQTPLVLLVVSFIVFLTQSRSALIALFGLIIPIYLIKNLKLSFPYFLIPILLIPILPISPPPRADLSLSQRLDLQGLSLKVISSYPIFGTGAQASISTYPLVEPTHRLLQPDHNSFTLFFSWFGVFGVLAILYLFRSLFENLRIYDLRLLLPLLPLLLLDHYFLTSPQGLFVFLLYVSSQDLTNGNVVHRNDPPRATGSV